MLLPLTTVERNLETKVKTCEEKIKSIEVRYYVHNSHFESCVFMTICNF